MPRFGEKAVLLTGLTCEFAGLLLTGLSGSPAGLYAGLAAIGVGSGFINPSISSLVSLYSPPEQQGRMLGVFRSLGALARGFGPVGTCLLYWCIGPSTTYALAALILLVPWTMALPLPRPAK